ncbi:MAG: hypothetical protein KC620_02765 [Myxococcales bacterium]|nr:hypothetical protein [Myxococcales bacterium]
MSDVMRRAVAALPALLLPLLLVASWLGAAERRLKESDPSAAEAEVAIASVSEDSYCTPKLKAIVRRVATACGLVSNGRGCQPMQAQTVAQLSDEEFNALFLPLEKRAHIVQFDAYQTDLDEAGSKAIDAAWADQRGASFFFVVARASPDGKTEDNEKLSAARAQSVLTHIERRFNDPDVAKQVGLLWLGENFAQLDESFCGWQRSRTEECTAKEINRSAFMAWIDCAI